MKKIEVHPIGHIQADDDGFLIRIDPEYRAGLLNLKGFDYLQVLFWCHLTDEPELRDMLEMDKPYQQAPERIGVFATRSPVRPNPIGLTPVRVIDLDASTGIITVSYIDAEPDTPILDLKPYHPCTDRVRDAGVPDWCSHWPAYIEESAEFNWEHEFLFPVG